MNRKSTSGAEIHYLVPCKGSRSYRSALLSLRRIRPIAGSHLPRDSRYRWTEKYDAGIRIFGVFLHQVQSFLLCMDRRAPIAFTFLLYFVMINGSTMTQEGKMHLLIWKNPTRRLLRRIAIPKGPYTMDGIPCNVSVVSLMVLPSFMFPLFAYSTRKIAEKIPKWNEAIKSDKML